MTSTNVLVSVSIPAQNILTKKQVGEEKVYSSYTSTLLFITKGSQDRNSHRVGSWSQEWTSHRRMLLTGLLPLASSACLLACFLSFSFKKLLFIYLYTPDFILLLVHPQTVPHPIPPSPPPPRECSHPIHPARPLNFQGPLVSWGLGTSSLTEPRPGSHLLYMCWGPHLSWCMLPGWWSSVWEISGVQVSWDCWSSYRVALLLIFFQIFPNSTRGVSSFCSLVECTYLHLTLSVACWGFERAVMIGLFFVSTP